MNEIQDKTWTSNAPELYQYLKTAKILSGTPKFTEKVQQKCQKILSDLSLQLDPLMRVTDHPLLKTRSFYEYTYHLSNHDKEHKTFNMKISELCESLEFQGCLEIAIANPAEKAFSVEEEDPQWSDLANTGKVLNTIKKICWSLNVLNEAQKTQCISIYKTINSLKGTTHPLLRSHEFYDCTELLSNADNLHTFKHTVSQLNASKEFQESKRLALLHIVSEDESVNWMDSKEGGRILNTLAIIQRNLQTISDSQKQQCLAIYTAFKLQYLDKFTEILSCETYKDEEFQGTCSFFIDEKSPLYEKLTRLALATRPSSDKSTQGGNSAFSSPNKSDEPRSPVLIDLSSPGYGSRVPPSSPSFKHDKRIEHDDAADLFSPPALDGKKYTSFPSTPTPEIRTSEKQVANETQTLLSKKIKEEESCFCSIL